MLDQFNKALNPDWSAWSYGNIERKPAPNDEKREFGYGYGDCIGYDSDVFLPSFRGFYWCGIDPRRVPDIRTQIVRGLGDASMLMTGVTFRRAFGQEDYQIIQENGILKQAFKDFLCYWFLVI